MSDRENPMFKGASLFDADTLQEMFGPKCKVIDRSTIPEEELMQKIAAAHRSQLKELALKNLEPTRVYIGYLLLDRLRRDASLLRFDGSTNERNKIFKCVVYEVGDDPEHIHFC